MSVELIALTPARPGFDRFFGPWLVRDGLNVLVDVGPAAWTPELLRALETKGVQRLDYVLLTHMHIDHCGGLAALLARYPTARAVGHGKGLRFLVDPSPLWEGSLRVLGDIARAYGRPEPISAERLLPHTRCAFKSVRIVETPGHAAHHLSYSLAGHLFAGEAAGSYLAMDGGVYLRPATPPRFFFDTCLQSLKRLRALEDMPLCYGHYGRAESSHRWLEAFSEQLRLWKQVIREALREDPETALQRSVEALLERDQRLKLYSHLDPATKRRESFFLRNSIKGFLGHLKQEGA